MAILDDLLNGNLSDDDSKYQSFLRAAASTPSQGFVEVSAQNIVIAKKLIDISRKLQDDGKQKLAREVLDEAAKLLENNEQLQKIVGDIKARID